MTKSTPDSSSKSSKRKGTRSVSTLTPSQLARKRANDREAQRAIRARTKEHIEGLERELEELRSTLGRDDTVQDLIQRNRALEDEVARLKQSMGLPTSGPQDLYQQSYHSSNSQSPAIGQRAPEYSGMDVGSYENLSPTGDCWPSGGPCTVSSTVSSPSSSGATDEVGTAYYPTSAPSTMLDRSGLSSGVNSPTASCVSGKLGYEDIKPELGYPSLNLVPIPQVYQQPPPWNMYPMYYQTSPAL